MFLYIEKNTQCANTRSSRCSIAAPIGRSKNYTFAKLNNTKFDRLTGMCRLEVGGSLGHPNVGGFALGGIEKGNRSNV